MSGVSEDAVESAVFTLGAHPKVFFFITLVAVFILGWSYKVFAEKTELALSVEQQQAALAAHIALEGAARSDLGKQIELIRMEQGELSATMAINFLLQDIARLDSEIYDIETLEASGQILQRDRQRLVQLRSQLTEKRRQLNLLSEP